MGELSINLVMANFLLKIVVIVSAMERADRSHFPAPRRHDAPQGPTKAAGAEALAGRCPSRPRRRHGPAALPSYAAPELS